MWKQKRISRTSGNVLKLVIHAMNGFHTKECLNKKSKKEGRKALTSHDLSLSHSF